METIITTIDLDNVLEYYGDIQIWILEEVLHLNPQTTLFTFRDAQFGTTSDDLYKIMTYWSKTLRG